MSPEILAISIYPELSQQLEEISKELNTQISIYNGGIMKDGHLYAKKMEDKYDVIISQGGTVEAIKEIVSKPVVSIEVNTADILRALIEAKEKFNNKIVLFTYKSDKLNELENVKNILNVEFKVATYENKKEYLEQTKKFLMEKDFTLVVLGNCMLDFLKDQDVNLVVVKSNIKAVRQAIIDARNICNLNIKEKERSKSFKVIIDYSSEAIIAIDKHDILTTFNSVAGRILQIRPEQVLGKKISDLDSIYNLNKICGDKSYKLDKMIEINDIKLILNRIPIVVEGKTYGTIITLQEVSKIQKLEQNVRNKLYSKGFIAKYSFNNILGVSNSIKEAKNKGIKYGRTSSTILIQGETGSGKELFAQSIHNISDRRNKPFIAVNCAALPEDLLESELFGYEEGAFTGAKKGGKPGLFELAHGGTIFLDEISEIPLSLQSRLLRVLQEREILRIGGDYILKVDVRVISATNKDLYKMVKENKFREDLFFRLNVLNLNIPPIRERKEDIPILVDEFVYKMNKKHNRKVKELTQNAIKLLMRYNWPGNVREIQNFVERMVVLSEKPIIDKTFIKDLFRETSLEKNKIEKLEDDRDCINVKIGTLNDMELQIIKEINSRVDSNKALLAEKLGISRTTLWKKIKEIDGNDKCF